MGAVPNDGSNDHRTARLRAPDGQSKDEALREREADSRSVAVARSCASGTFIAALLPGRCITGNDTEGNCGPCATA